MTTEFYVYQYVTEQGTPYYIGKGSKYRIRQKHLYTVVPPIERRIIVKSALTEEQAFNLENKLIREYGRKIDGGVLDNIKLNQWACATGWKHSEETKHKISKANRGKVRTEEHKQKYRQPKTKEHAENIRKANLGKHVANEVRQKISNTLKGNIPWNKGIKGTQWTQARRDAYLKNKELIGTL
jgi:hypothetical protein